MEAQQARGALQQVVGHRGGDGRVVYQLRCSEDGAVAGEAVAALANDAPDAPRALEHRQYYRRRQWCGRALVRCRRSRRLLPIDIVGVCEVQQLRMFQQRQRDVPLSEVGQGLTPRCTARHRRD